MIELTDIACEKLTRYMDNNNFQSPLRVMLYGSCSGPSLGLALDEVKREDAEFHIREHHFVIDRKLLAECGSISIDFITAGGSSGFTISSSRPLPDSGGGCGPGTCGTGGCGC